MLRRVNWYIISDVSKYFTVFETSVAVVNRLIGCYVVLIGT